MCSRGQRIHRDPTWEALKLQPRTLIHADRLSWGSGRRGRGSCVSCGGAPRKLRVQESLQRRVCEGGGGRVGIRTDPGK